MPPVLLLICLCPNESLAGDVRWLWDLNIRMLRDVVTDKVGRLDLDFTNNLVDTVHLVVSRASCTVVVHRDFKRLRHGHRLVVHLQRRHAITGRTAEIKGCLLYTSDAADEEDSVGLGGRRILQKKKRR